MIKRSTIEIEEIYLKMIESEDYGLIINARDLIDKLKYIDED